MFAIQYRLNTLGFLALPELTEESPTHSVGNFGLMDQRLAIRWAAAHAAFLGGSKEGMTVFGQSAGAVSTCLHSANRADIPMVGSFIAQSGMCDSNQWVSTPDTAYEMGQVCTFALLMCLC